MPIGSHQQLRLLSLVLFTALFVGCSSLPSVIPSQKPSPATSQATEPLWRIRQEAAYQVNDWLIQAKLGLKTAQQSGSASLVWQQQSSTYDIRIAGPFGQGQVHIQGKPGKVTLESAKTGFQSATTPEDLLFQQTGWVVPLSQLAFWIRGIPAPGNSDSVLNDNLVTQITQAGWQIDYERYDQYGALWLPGKITLTKESVQLKVIVKNWQLNPK